MKQLNEVARMQQLAGLTEIKVNNPNLPKLTYDKDDDSYTHKDGWEYYDVGDNQIQIGGWEYGIDDKIIRQFNNFLKKNNLYSEETEDGDQIFLP